jgi:hypothetical protein
MFNYAHTILLLGPFYQETPIMIYETKIDNTDLE